MLDELAAFPARLRAWTKSVPAERRTIRARDGRFALVEHAWHLADLEEEGYGPRLARLLSEEAPHFDDFDGERIARERNYLAQELEPALVRFARARAANVAIITNASERDRAREGTQEGAGRVTFARVVEMMREHDDAHAQDIEALLQELSS